MATIKVQHAPKIQSRQQRQGSNDNLKDTIAVFCYYYPQYSFAKAMDLPIKLVRRMLRAVRREQAMNYLELINIARVAQFEKHEPYTELAERYQREARNG